jgi:hypothetical protein
MRVKDTFPKFSPGADPCHGSEDARADSATAFQILPRQRVDRARTSEIFQKKFEIFAANFSGKIPPSPCLSKVIFDQDAFTDSFSLIVC